MGAPPQQPGRRFVVGITGASGACYALRLLDVLLQQGHEVHLVVTDYGRRLLADEAGIRAVSPDDLTPHLPLWGGHGPGRLVVHPARDTGAVVASGSFRHDGMVVIPATSQSLCAIASGAGSNLLIRAAHVALKERRPLIVCHREMPLSLIDIEAMRRLTLAGGIVCPTNPGFYLNPRSIADLVDFVVGRVLDLLGVAHTLGGRWGERQGGSDDPA